MPADCATNVGPVFGTHFALRNIRISPYTPKTGHASNFPKKRHKHKKSKHSLSTMYKKRSCEIRDQHTFVDRLDERFDVPCLPKDERRERIGGGTVRKRRRRRQRQRGVDGDAGGVVAPVLEAPQAIEEDLEYVTPLSADVVIQIGEYAAHSSFSPLLSSV